jgi:hypothetical protein
MGDGTGRQATQAVAIGYAAGASNGGGTNGQGQSSIAIGAYGGGVNQAANSIAVNATGTGSGITANQPGLFIAPVRSVANEVPASVLAYDSASKEIRVCAAPPCVGTSSNRTAVGEGAVNTANGQVVLGNNLVNQVVGGGNGTCDLGTAATRWRNVHAQKALSENFEVNLPNGAISRMRIGTTLAPDIGSMASLPPQSGATADWAIWEWTKPSFEASFIAQNGDTTVICNPGDSGALNWIDEDGGSAYTGWQISPTGTITAISDARLKKEVNPLSKMDGLSEKFAKLRFVSYKQKSLGGSEKEEGRQRYETAEYGVVAQEVRNILPEIVSSFGEDSDAYMGVNYNHLSVFGHYVLQQQMSRIDELEKRLAMLQKKINT